MLSKPLRQLWGRILTMLTMQGFTTLVAAASFDHVEVPLGNSFSLAVRCAWDGHVE
jgi:hypothetical protein